MDESSETAPPKKMSLIAKIFAVLAIGGVLMAITAGIGVWMVWSKSKSVPEFYESIPVVEGEALLQKSEEAEQAARDLLAASSPEAKPAPKFEGEPSAATEPPATVTLTETQINAWLATHEDDLGMGSEVSAPRVKLGQDSFQFGVRVDVPQYQGVLSVDAIPELVTGSSIVVELTQVRIGMLPIRATTLLNQFQVTTDDLPAELTIEDDKLLATLDWTDEDIALRLASIAISPDGVTLVPSDGNEANQTDQPAGEVASE